MRYIGLVRKGDRVSLTVSSLDGDGAGVALAGAHRVHVAGALPDEEIEASVAHVSPHRPEAWARLERIRVAAAARVAPPCPAFGACGGCVLMHLDYPAQLGWKRRLLVDALAAVPRLDPALVGEVVPSPRPFGYRNRVKLVYARRDGRAVLGAYAPRSHEVVDLAGCQIGEAPLDGAAGALATVLDRHPIAPYDERAGAGLLRYVVLRANHLGEVLGVLVTAAAEVPGLDEVVADWRAARPEVIGVVQNVNPSRGNVIFGSETRVLAGAGELEEKIGPVHLRLSPTAFLQANREVAARLYADLTAQSALTGTERVIDCYAGAGAVALTLAPRAAEVVAIEEHAAAVADGVVSAQRNHAPRTRFVAGDAALRLAELDAADVIVVNPPRGGCARPVLEAVGRLAPRTLLYVSCAADTLARDLTLLDGLGFRPVSLTPYDMLPHTPHVEILAHLSYQP
jgi:23S rRNA (uracil1939-C5)-methyltransferase